MRDWGRGWQVTDQYLLEFHEKQSLVFTFLEKLRENNICRTKQGRLKLLLCVGHFPPICCWWLMLACLSYGTEFLHHKFLCVLRNVLLGFLVDCVM